MKLPCHYNIAVEAMESAPPLPGIMGRVPIGMVESVSALMYARCAKYASSFTHSCWY